MRGYNPLTAKDDCRSSTFFVTRPPANPHNLLYRTLLGCATQDTRKFRNIFFATGLDSRTRTRYTLLYIVKPEEDAEDCYYVTELSEEVKAAMKYLFCSEQEAKFLKEKNTHKEYLKKYINQEGEPDENGNIIWYFDKPLMSSDGIHKGLMLQRRISEYTDEELGLELVKDLGLDVRCITREYVEHLDLNEVYVCNQEGLITDNEIDSLIVINETWALVKIKE